jgi:uncharacterized membrane protein
MKILFTHFELYLAATCLLILPGIASAYVGPGAGITMLGSLWGLILAIVFVLVGILILPYKIIRNRMKQKKAEEAAVNSTQEREVSDEEADQKAED